MLSGTLFVKRTKPNIISYTSYLLATNPGKQQLVLDEIDALHLNDVVEMTLEMANEMHYLDMVMKEALRMHPMVALCVGRLHAADLCK